MRAEVMLLAALPVFAQTGEQWFAYDEKAPLGYSETQVSDREGVRVFDARFTSPKGGTVLCYVVAPLKKSKYAGIIWQHGGGGDRQWFLPEAIELARLGAVSVLLEAPFNRPEELRAKPDPDIAVQSRNDMIQVAVDARRAFDVLAARDDVDVERIGFTGASSAR